MLVSADAAAHGRKPSHSSHVFQLSIRSHPFPTCPVRPIVLQVPVSHGTPLRDVPWDKLMAFFAAIETAMDGRSRDTGAVRDVAHRHSLRVKRLQGLDVVAGLDWPYLPLLPDQPRLEGLGVRPIEPSRLLEVDLEAGALCRGIVRRPAERSRCPSRPPYGTCRAACRPCRHGGPACGLVRPPQRQTHSCTGTHESASFSLSDGHSVERLSTMTRSASPITSA